MTLSPDLVARARDTAILDVALRCGAKLRRAGAEWNGPCPGCGGRDRFWANEAKNMFLCRMSGAQGDPIALMRHVQGCGFREAVEMLTGERALPSRARAEAAPPDNQWREKARRAAWAIWRAGRSIRPETGGHLVADYLALRAIPFPGWPCPALREIPQLAYWSGAKGGRDNAILHAGPAMLAAITGPDGHFIGVHRTWLDLSRPNGKAVIADPETGELLDAKKVMGSQRGGKVVLRSASRDASAASPPVAPAGRPMAAGGQSAARPAGGADSRETGNSFLPFLALGEGIETVLSWDALHPGQAQALWCGINLDNIAGRAAEQIPHPSRTVTDSLGRVRRARVGGPNPAPGDTDCLQVPACDFAAVILLGDADSDRYATQAAMLRAERRLGLPARTDWAPDGQDWNDALAGRGRQRAVA